LRGDLILAADRNRMGDLRSAATAAGKAMTNTDSAIGADSWRDDQLIRSPSVMAMVPAS